MAQQYSLGDAILYLKGNDSSFNAMLGAAEKHVKSTVGNIQSTLSGIGKGMSIMGGAVVGALGALVYKTAEYGDNIDEMSQRTGLSTDKIQELRYAANQTGGSLEGLEGMSKKLSKAVYAMGQQSAAAGEGGVKKLTKEQERLKEANEKISAQYRNVSNDLAIATARYQEASNSGKAHGSQLIEQRIRIGELRSKLGELNTEYGENNKKMREATAAGGDMEPELRGAAKALGDLGLSQKDLAGLNPDQLFDKVAEALAGVKDKTMQSALAQQVLGKTGLSMLPMLESGIEGYRAMQEEARKYGLVLDEKTVKESGKFKDMLGVLSLQLQAVAYRIGSELIPKLMPLAEKVRGVLTGVIDWISKNPELTAKIGMWAAAIGAAGMVFGPFLFALSSAIGIVSKLSYLFKALTLVKFLPAIAGWLGSLSGGGLLGLLGTLGAIAGAAGVGWALGRWIDKMTENTAFGKWIDRQMDSLVKFVDKIKEWLGLAEPMAKMGSRTEEILKSGKVKVDAQGNVLPGQGAPQHYAGGTNSAPGGWSWVGEHGPELMNIPRGARILSNSDSKRAAASSSGPITNHFHIDSGGKSSRQLAEELAKYIVPAIYRRQRQFAGG